MNDDFESGVIDILVEKKISGDLICKILARSFGVDEDSVLVVSREREYHENNFSNIPFDIPFLCFTHKAVGDVSLMLTVCCDAVSYDLALHCLIRNFINFGISSYFVKDEFEDFYHVTESGSLVIATQIYGDDDDTGVYHFETTGAYDGSLGDSFL